MTEPHTLCDVIKAQRLLGRIVRYTATTSEDDICHSRPRGTWGELYHGNSRIRQPNVAAYNYVTILVPNL